VYWFGALIVADGVSNRTSTALPSMPGGVMANSLVFEIGVTEVASESPNQTAVTPSNPEPEKVTCDPPLARPLFGTRLDTEGLTYVNALFNDTT
jgi:hypothetical protein